MRRTDGRLTPPAGCPGTARVSGRQATATSAAALAAAAHNANVALQRQDIDHDRCDGSRKTVSPISIVKATPECCAVFAGNLVSRTHCCHAPVCLRHLLAAIR